METRSREAAERLSLLPGEEVGHFQVLRFIAAGGMGAVYLAEDRRLGRRVALKFVGPSRAAGDAHERVLSEGRAIARLSHEHIVTVYDVGEHQGSPYLALEYLEGETLRDRMRSGRPGLLEAVRIGRAIASGLAAAHASAVIHRDLKPENIIIASDGRLRVLDFGLAADVRRVSAHDASRSWGTPGYLSPERWAGAPATEAADVWALGLILHELLTGVHPYEALLEAPGGLAATVRSPAPVPLDAELRIAPDQIRALVGRCLAKATEERPVAADVALALDRMLSRGADGGAEDQPFRELAAFGAADARWFFGRAAEIDTALERLRSTALLSVVGPSGTGKSSFVHAGVVPRLQEQATWILLGVRPGARPFRTLAAALQPSATAPLDASTVRAGDTPVTTTLDILEARLREAPERLGLELRRIATDSRSRVLLVVDQLEEALTLVPDPEERRGFLRALYASAPSSADPVRVLLCLRDDFIGRVAEQLGPRQPLTGVFPLGVPGDGALREILTSPLSLVGYRYEDEGLVDEMIEAVREETTCLPLLQFTAAQLWRRRDRDTRKLLRSAYEEVGGVSGALAGHADGVLDAMGESGRQAAHDLFMRLVTPQRTRRVVSRPALLAGLAPGAGDVLDTLLAARLLAARTGEDAEVTQLELAHESLVDSWGRLTLWLDEGSADREILTDLEKAAELWEKRGQRPELLWSGDALNEADAALARQATAPDERHRRFVAASRERSERRRRRRRLMLWGGVMLLLAITAVSLIAAFMLSERERAAKSARLQAEHSRAEAASRGGEALLAGARAALLRGELVEARARLRASLELADTRAARMLWRRLDADPLEWRSDIGGIVQDLVLTPDGDAVIVADHHRRVSRIDGVTAARTTVGQLADQATALAISAGGARIAAASWDGSITIWQGEGAPRKFSAEVGQRPLIAFGPRSAELAVGSRDGRLALRDLDLGSEIRSIDTGAPLTAIAMASSGRHVAGAHRDGSLSLWTTGAERVERWGEDTRDERRIDLGSVAFSPDGTLVAVATPAGPRLYRVGDGSPIALPRAEAVRVAQSVAFSGDGHRLAAQYSSGEVRLWALDDRAPCYLHSFRGCRPSISLDHDGGRVFCPDRGSKRGVRVSRSDRRYAAPRIPAHRFGLHRMAFSHDGRSLFTGGNDDALRVWDVARAEVREHLPWGGSPVGERRQDMSVAVHVPSRRVVYNGARSLYVTSYERPIEAPLVMPLGGSAEALAMHPEGNAIAVGRSNGRLELWRVEDGVPPSLAWRAVLGAGYVRDAAFSPDGASIASAGIDGRLRLWDVVTGEARPLRLGHDAESRSVVFGPAGRRLISGGLDGRIKVSSLDRQVTEQSLELDARVYRVALHPDGRRIAAATSANEALLWDPATDARIRYRGHRSEVNVVAFDPSGRLLATGSDDHSVRVWDVESGRPIWRAPLLRTERPELFTQLGWRDAAAGAEREVEAARWRKHVEEQARLAAEAPGSLCVVDQAGALQRWELRTDAVAGSWKLGGADPWVVQVVALGDACIVRTADGVFATKGAALEQLSGPSLAMGTDNDALLLARAGTVRRLNLAGAELGRWSGPDDTSAVARLDGRLVAGTSAGTVYDVKDARHLLGTPTGDSVLSMRAGPGGAWVTGHRSGAVKVWLLDGAELVESSDLHGPVKLMQRYGDVVVAASEIGQYVAMDLGILARERCALLREIWANVPLAWVNGRPRREGPPPAHACYRKSAGSTP